MDFFGIGAAVKAIFNVYSIASRGTFRTSHLVDNLCSGDCVYFVDSQDANRVFRLCQERGVIIEARVARDFDTLYNDPRGTGRTLLDHRLVEELYEKAIDNCCSMIDQVERKLSATNADPVKPMQDPRYFQYYK